MKRFSPFLIPLLLLLSFTFCGKKGPILPPLKKILQKIEAFDITQRGERIIFEWENPTTYVDGSPLTDIFEVEIWLFEEERESAEKEESGGDQQISLEEFEKGAKLAASIKKEEFSEHRTRRAGGSVKLRYFYKLTAEDFGLKNLNFGLRVKDKKKRKSAFSNLLSIEPRILSLPPQGIQATVFEDRIEIKWSLPERNFDQSSPPNLKGYNIYRVDREGFAHRLNSELIEDRKYEDRDIIIGRVYRYFLRAAATDSKPYAESDNSEVIEILAKDTFPPSAPSGLVSVAAENLISLSWDVNLEEDLAGYRVWRKAEGEDEYISLTPQLIQENAFNDTTVEKNKRYHYAITAQDKSGNESPKSESISEIIKD